MSLLLEALKKAEKAKRENVPAASPRDEAGATSDSGHGIALEMPPPESPSGKPDSFEFSRDETQKQNDSLPSLTQPEVEFSAESQGQAFPEISLIDIEVPEPASATSEAGITPSEPIIAERVDVAPKNFQESKGDSCTPELVLEHKDAQDETPPPITLSQPEKKIEPVLALDFPEHAAASSKINAPPMQATTPSAMPPEPTTPRQQIVTPTNTKAVSAPEPAEQILTHVSPASVNDTAQKQETAKNILSAKQGKPKRNLKLLGGLLAVSMAIGAAGAYYYWLEISKLTPPTLPQPAPPPPPEQLTAQQQPTVQPAKEEEKDTAEADATEEAHNDAKTNRKPQQQEPAAAGQSPAPKKTYTKQNPPEKQPAPALAEPLLVKNTAAHSKADSVSIRSPESIGTSENGIKFRRDAGSAKLDPLLTGAYQAFMAGDISKAENDYRKALQQTPNNRDALLGLAAIAANRGQAQEAASIYLRVLQLDPKDSAAQTGLIGLKGYSDPTLSESRLKTLLAQQPDVGYLHFALGNLYAYQARWPEAQEAYFNALHCDGGNADYAFNLAVSLDHLDQRKPALAYYQRALTLVKDRSASFDSEQLKKRIHELQAN